MCPCLGGHIDAAPASLDDEGFGRWASRGSITQRQHLLSYASRFVLPLTRKAGFRLAGLYREGVEPSGSLRKVSDHMTILLSCSPDATQIAADLTRSSTRQPWAKSCHFIQAAFAAVSVLALPDG